MMVLRWCEQRKKMGDYAMTIVLNLLISSLFFFLCMVSGHSHIIKKAASGRSLLNIGPVLYNISRRIYI